MKIYISAYRNFNNFFLYNLLKLINIHSRGTHGGFILYILIIIISSYCRDSFAQSNYRNTTVLDTPTAYTINRGTYQLSCLGYNNGGVELKTFIGLHDNVFIGVSFDIQNAIGKDNARPNIPGVVAKLKITDGWETFPISSAIGYDSFYIGQEGKTNNYKNELNRMIYGPYFVITKPIYLFYDEQHVHFGIRVPTQPDYVSKDTSYFISLDVPLGESVTFKAEGERIYYNFQRPREWLLNLGLKYSYLNHIGIEIVLMMQKQDRANRIIKIEYNDEF